MVKADGIGWQVDGEVTETVGGVSAQLKVL